jgi:hypothetical protein
MNPDTTPFYDRASVIVTDVSIIWLSQFSFSFDFSGRPIRHLDDQMNSHGSRLTHDLVHMNYLE